MVKGYAYMSHQLSLSAVAGQIKTQYFSLHGEAIFATDPVVRMKIAENTAKKLFLRIISVVGAEIDLSVTVRKNGVDTGLQILNKRAVGYHEVTSDVAFADGDEVSIKVVADNEWGETTQSITFRVCTCFLSP